MCRLTIPGNSGRAYHSFSPHPAYKTIVLDTYDDSVLGWPQDSAEHQASSANLRAHNTNEVRTWQHPAGRSDSLAGHRLCVAFARAQHCKRLVLSTGVYLLGRMCVITSMHDHLDCTIE